MATKAKRPPPNMPPLFIGKDAMATFWFFVTILTMLGCAVYLERVAASAGKSAQFIILENNDPNLPDSEKVTPLEHELAPEVESEMHMSQTRLAMDTVFNKNPEGLDSKDRCRKLMTQKAYRLLQGDLIAGEKDAFHDNRIHQKVEIEWVDIHKVSPTETLSNVKGRLLRTGKIDGKFFNEIWTVRASFLWIRNTCLRDCGQYPTVCTTFTSSESPVASTINYVKAEETETPRSESAPDAQPAPITN